MRDAWLTCKALVLFVDTVLLLAARWTVAGWAVWHLWTLPPWSTDWLLWFAVLWLTLSFYSRQEREVEREQERLA